MTPQTRTTKSRSKSVTSLGDALGSLARSQQWEEKLQRYQAWQIWDQAVGPQIAAHARPSRLRKTVLEVTVDQPVWMQQLQLMKPQLLAKLNAHLGQAPIDDIFLRRGRLPIPEAPSSATTSGPRPRALSPEEEARIADLLQAVSDPDLHQCLKRILRKQTGLTEP